MNKLDKTQSPIVNKTFEARFKIQRTRNTFVWGICNFLVALVLYVEMSYGSTARALVQLTHPIVYFAEWILVGIFLINGLFQLWRYFSPSLTLAPVELTPRQKILLGVKDSETGFRMAKPKAYAPGGTNNNLVISPSSYSGHTSLTSTSTPLGSPLMAGVSRRYTPPQRTPTPPHFSNTSAGYSPGSASGSYLNSSSFISPGVSFNSSRSASFHRSGTASPLTPGQSPSFRDSMHDTSGLRTRLTNVSRSSALNSDDCLTDVRALDKYIKEQSHKESRSHIGSPESSPGSAPSFWNYSRSVMDYAPVLRKYQYQMACRDPQSTKSLSSDPDDPATYRSDEVWARLKVHGDELDAWIENLRRWLSQTIFVRVSTEIKNINNILTRIGSEDMKIGEVSISTLKQLGVTKAVHVPTLNAIIPFLEVSTNQEYLVQRIHELAEGGCIHEYKWNGGSDFKGKAWQESMPCDSEIVAHMLCSYMDSRLPPHPNFPDGKTFTSQYFKKTPDKPDFTKKEQVVIFQSKLRPPHYKVILGEDTWDLPRGRTNFFQAVLHFLHHIQNNEHGMLGRINLGMSGINILWVLEK